MVPRCPVRRQHHAGLAVTGDLMVMAAFPSAQDLLNGGGLRPATTQKLSLLCNNHPPPEQWTGLDKNLLRSDFLLSSGSSLLMSIPF